MKLKQTKSENLRRAYDVTVPAKDVDAQINARLQQLSKTVKISGFRPGKVPLSVVKKQYGQNIMGEVLQKLVDGTTNEAIKKEKLRPAYQPKIEIKEFEEGKDLTFSLELEVLPDLPKVNFADITIEQPAVDVTDEQVKDALDRIASQSKDFQPVAKKRAAKNGDAVLIDFKGFLGDEAFEGGEAQGHQLELGSNSFIPGFEEQLVGTKAGDSLDVKVTFPKEYHSEKLAGQEAKFEVTVHDVLEVAEQKVDDSFAEKLGLKDLETLKDAIRSQIENEIKQTIRFYAKKNLFDALDEAYKFDVPEEMLKQEFDAIWKQVDPKAEENKGKSEKALKEEYEEMAARRVRLGLLLAEIGATEKIKVTDQEMQQAVLQEARRYPGQEKLVFDHYKEHPEQLQALRGPILEEKVVDLLLDQVKVTEKKASIEELEDGTWGEKAAPKKKTATKKPAAKKDTESKKPAAKKTTKK